MANERPKAEPMLVSSRTAAGMLGVSSRTMQRLTESGALPCVRMTARSGARWVPVEALELFVASGGVRPTVVRPVYCGLRGGAHK